MKIKKTLATIALGLSMPLAMNAQTADIQKYTYQGKELNDIIKIEEERKNPSTLLSTYIIPSTGYGESYIVEACVSVSGLEEARKIAIDNNSCVFYDIKNKVVICEGSQTIPKEELELTQSGDRGSYIGAPRKLIEYKADWERYNRLNKNGSKIFAINNQGDLMSPSKIEADYKTVLDNDGDVSHQEYNIAEKF